MEKKWKHFERLVAAVHLAFAGADARIKWDDDIEGRQFDLTIRFSHLTYDYLTVVEVKDYLVPVKEVEAFVTKARRARANKTVMVSSAGFQSGAIEVARDEHVDLFVLKEAEDWPQYVKVVQEKPVIGITDVELLDPHGSVLHQFPTLSSALRYFVESTLIISPQKKQTLDELIMGKREEWEPSVTSERSQITLPLSSHTRVEVPFVDPIPSAAVRFSAELAKGLEIDSGGIDLSMIPALFSFRNVITGEDRRIGEADIWLGIETEIRPGRFYHDPLHSMNYYCEARIGNSLTYVILESYQHGKLFQAEVKQTLTGRVRVVEIEDAREIQRLKRMHDQFRRKSSPISPSNPPKVGRNDPCSCGSGKKYKKCHGSNA
jgi:hypothetical protein